MRNGLIDVTKVVMSFMVIIIHVNNVFGDGALNYVIVNGFCRLAVPFFLVVTGYYFFNIISIADFSKWAIRVVKLYLFWMILYSPFWIGGIKGTIINLATGYYTLWYINGIFFAGALLFYFRRETTIKIVSLSISLFLIGYAIQFAAIHYHEDGWTAKLLGFYPAHRNFLFYCFPIMSIGFLVNRYGISKIKIRFSYVIISLLLVFLEAYYSFLTALDQKPTDLTLSAFVATPILFIYLFNKDFHAPFKKLSMFSSGVFLSQVVFLNLYKELFHSTGVLDFLFVSIATSISSILLIKLSTRYKFII